MQENTEKDEAFKKEIIALKTEVKQFKNEKEKLEIYVQFLKCIMSDWEATYESRGTKFEKRESAKKAKSQKQIDSLNASNQSAGSLSIKELEMHYW